MQKIQRAQRRLVNQVRLRVSWIQWMVKNGFRRLTVTGTGRMRKIKFGALQVPKDIQIPTVARTGMFSGLKVVQTVMCTLGEEFAGDHCEEHRSD